MRFARAKLFLVVSPVPNISVCRGNEFGCRFKGRTHSHFFQFLLLSVLVSIVTLSIANPSCTDVLESRSVLVR